MDFAQFPLSFGLIIQTVRFQKSLKPENLIKFWCFMHWKWLWNQNFAESFLLSSKKYIDFPANCKCMFQTLWQTGHLQKSSVRKFQGIIDLRVIQSVNWIRIRKLISGSNHFAVWQQIVCKFWSTPSVYFCNSWLFVYEIGVDQY